MKYVIGPVLSIMMSSGVCLAQESSASSDLEAIIGKVQTVYQTDRLARADTIRLEEDIRSEYDGHDYGPDIHDLTAQRRHHVLNLGKQIGSSEYLTMIANTNYHARSVFIDNNVRFIDYGNGAYQDLGVGEYYARYGATIRSSDVLLAHALVKAKDSARYTGKKTWLGLPHDKITFDHIPNSPPLTVYIEKSSGHISKMTRPSGEQLLTYTFDHHRQQEGIVIAREHSVYLGDEPLYYSYNRRLAVNDPVDASAFEIDKGITLEPQRVDQSKMTVDALSENAHQVGQGENYTMFINSGNALIAFGADAGFAERLKAYREETGNLQPLEYVVVADHHRPEIAGVSEAAKAGGVILSTKDAASKLQPILSGEGIDARLETVTDTYEIGDIKIINIPTAHASSILTLFDKRDALLVQSGHYASPYRDTGFYAKYTAVTFARALAKYKLSPQFLVSTGSRKAEHWSDFSQAVKNHDRTACHQDRRICIDS